MHTHSLHGEAKSHDCSNPTNDNNFHILITQKKIVRTEACPPPAATHGHRPVNWWMAERNNFWHLECKNAESANSWNFGRNNIDMGMSEQFEG